jgi:PAS domain S-box-containing protein
MTHSNNTLAALATSLRRWVAGTNDKLSGPGACLARPANETGAQGESDQWFTNLFGTAATGVAIAAPRGRILLANAPYCRMLGYTQDELRLQDAASLIHPADRAQILQLHEELLTRQRDNFIIEARYLRKSGEIQWVRSALSTVAGLGQDAESVITFAGDIAERKNAEARLARANRLRLVLSNVSDAIVRASSRQDLYDTVCRTVVTDGLLRMAFIMELDAETMHAHPVAAFGAGQDHLWEPHVHVPIAEGPFSQGTVGVALRTGRYDVCNDIANTARMQPWWQITAQHSLLSNGSFPLTLHGVTIGVLTMYAPEADYFRDDEIGLMVTVANNLSFALEAFDKEQKRCLAEAQSAQLAAIVESSDDAIIGKDLHGIVTSWNNGAERLFGYTKMEMVGEPVTKLIPADRIEEQNRIEAAIQRGESVRNFETLRQAKSGRLIDVSVTASPICTAAGDVVGVSTVAHDITEARRSAARFRRLVDSNIQGVFFWNLQGGVTEANDAFLTLVRYSREDLAAGLINWIAMTPPEYAKLNRHSIAEMAERGACTPFEKEYIRKDGTRVPILVGAATFEDDPNEGVCFVLDLTEHRNLERQFRQAQKMEGIGTLAGGVAHDFNNLLAVIQMQADLLVDEGGLSPTQAESADEIGATVQRAAALTRQLLLFSSRETFQPRELDLSESIVETTRLLKRIVGEHIEMQIKMAAEPMVLHADPGMMDQILLNLVVNARDAMPNGGRLVIETAGVTFDELAMSQSIQMRPGSFVCLSVTDTGCGIPPETLPQIFEPFFTTKDVGKGTGLGLSTVFGIVRQHHGWINVYSEVGHGTTFRVYIPRVARDAKPAVSQTAPLLRYSGTELSHPLISPLQFWG